MAAQMRYPADLQADAEQLAEARAYREKMRQEMVDRSLALGNTPTRAQLKAHEKAIDAYQWAEMEYGRAWDIWRTGRRPGPVEAYGERRDLPPAAEPREAFWSRVRAQADAKQAKADAAAAGKKRKERE